MVACCTRGVVIALRAILFCVCALGAVVAAHAWFRRSTERPEEYTGQEPPSVMLVHATWNAESQALLRSAWPALKRDLPGVRFEERDETTSEGASATRYPTVSVVGGGTHTGEHDLDALKAFVMLNVPADAIV